MKSLYKKYRAYIGLAVLTVFTTILLWLPFIPQTILPFIHIKGTDTGIIYRHYDGPLYIIAAKTFYNPQAIRSLQMDNPLPDKYFAAHLPLYPITIRILKMLGIKYVVGMLVSTVLFSVLMVWTFYFIVRKLQITKHPFILTVIFMMLPRLLVVRSVGSPEPLFILLVLGSLFAFEREKYALAGLLGGLAAMTKSPGILLFPAYILVFGERWYHTRKLNYGILWTILIPLGFLAVCLIYSAQYKDFFAYFHSGDNIHLVAPFAAFNSRARWVGTAWLEDILFYFLLYALTVVYLYKSKRRSFFYFAAVFYLAVLCVEHRDIARYSLPLWPLACMQFADFFTSRKFLIASLIVSIGIYAYAWNFMQSNVMPISIWTPFM